MGTHLLVSVVDDDESVRESLPDLIKEFGFAVQAFASAQAFLASPYLDLTHCLILDVAMPGMSVGSMAMPIQLIAVPSSPTASTISGSMSMVATALSKARPP